MVEIDELIRDSLGSGIKKDVKLGLEWITRATLKNEVWYNTYNK